MEAASMQKYAIPWKQGGSFRGSFHGSFKVLLWKLAWKPPPLPRKLKLPWKRPCASVEVDKVSMVEMEASVEAAEGFMKASTSFHNNN